MRTGLVFYGRDRSTDGTIFYRPVVDRLEIYLISCGKDDIFTPAGLDNCSHVKLLYGGPGLHHIATCILRTGLRHFEPVTPL